MCIDSYTDQSILLFLILVQGPVSSKGGPEFVPDQVQTNNNIPEFVLVVRSVFK